MRRAAESARGPCPSRSRCRQPAICRPRQRSRPGGDERFLPVTGEESHSRGFSSSDATWMILTVAFLPPGPPPRSRGRGASQGSGISSIGDECPDGTRSWPQERTSPISPSAVPAVLPCAGRFSSVQREGNPGDSAPTQIHFPMTQRACLRHDRSLISKANDAVTQKAQNFGPDLMAVPSAMTIEIRPPAAVNRRCQISATLVRAEKALTGAIAETATCQPGGQPVALVGRRRRRHRGGGNGAVRREYPAVCIARRDATKVPGGGGRHRDQGVARRRAFSVDARREQACRPRSPPSSARSDRSELCLFNAGSNVNTPLTDTSATLFRKSVGTGLLWRLLTGREAHATSCRARVRARSCSPAPAVPARRAGLRRLRLGKFGLRALAQSMARARPEEHPFGPPGNRRRRRQRGDP